MGTFTGNLLANGQVAAAEADLYKAPAATVGYVKQVTLFNTDASTQTVTIWIKKSGGTSRKIRRIELTQNESCDLLDQGETCELGAGDAIRAASSNANVVDFTVMGVEEA